MLQSVRDQIITAFCDALLVEGGPEVKGLARSPAQRLGPDRLPCYVVIPGAEEITADSHETQLRTLTLRVLCIYSDPDVDDESLDQKVDPLTSWVESRIAADETFGGLALASAPTGIQWHIDDADADYIGAEMTIGVQYSTGRNAPDERG